MKLGYKAGSTDVDTHGYLTLCTSGAIILFMTAEGTSTLF